MYLYFSFFSFNKIKERTGGSQLLTDSQKEWVEAQKIIRTAKLTPLLRRPLATTTSLHIRSRIFDLVTNKYFDAFIASCIFLNVVVMASAALSEPFWWTVTQEYLNYFFSFVFTMEAVLKIMSFNPKQYFRDSWNVFDFTIVLGADAGIVVTLMGIGGSFGGVISIVRMFRVARVLRLVKQLKGLQQLFDTMILSFPALINIGFLFFLIMFIFAVIGVELFAVNQLDNSLYLTSHSNFQTVGNAFLVMYKWSTGENWNGMMEQMAGRTAGKSNCSERKRKYVPRTIFFPFLFLNFILERRERYLDGWNCFEKKVIRNSCFSAMLLGLNILGRRVDSQRKSVGFH